MRCVGITKKIDRCKNKAGFLFCRTHRSQWLGLVTLIAMFAGLYQDLIKPAFSIFKKSIEYNVGILPLNPSASDVLKGKITDSLHNRAYQHYIFKKIREDRLPLNEIGKYDFN